MDKLKLAHDYFMKHVNTDQYKHLDDEDLILWSFDYADAMKAELDKRNKAEAAQKRKEIREMLNASNTFFEREGQHFDDVEEWQPDWSQAPEGAKYWAMDKCGMCNWYAEKPEICGNQWDFGRAVEQAHTGYGYQGNWQDSLRKRPQ